MKAELRAVQPGDVDHLVANIRPADADECEALFGSGSLHDSIGISVATSAMVLALVFNGQLAALFGVAPVNILSGTGAPWMVGTPLMDDRPSAHIRLAKTIIPKMHELFPNLVNVVDARNVRSIRYLKGMGFTILDPMPMGARGLPFHPFYRAADQGE